MKKISFYLILLLSILIGIVSTISIKIFAFENNIYKIVEIDKSDMCKAMLKNQYVITIKNLNEEFIFFRVPNEYDTLQVNDNVILEEKNISIENIKYNYIIDNGNYTIISKINDIKVKSDVVDTFENCYKGLDLTYSIVNFDTTLKLNYDCYKDNNDGYFVHFENGYYFGWYVEYEVDGIFQNAKYISLALMNENFLSFRVDIYVKLMIKNNETIKDKWLLESLSLYYDKKFVIDDIKENMNTNIFLFNKDKLNAPKYVDIQINDVKIENCNLNDYFLIEWINSYYEISKNFNENELWKTIGKIDKEFINQDYLVLLGEFSLLVESINIKYKVYTFIIKDSYLINANGNDQIINRKVNSIKQLMIDNEIFTHDYDIENYDEVQEINKLEDFKQYNGLKGNVIISTTIINNKLIYQLDLYSFDSKEHLRLKLDGFINDISVKMIYKSSFIILNNELILELVLDNSRILYDVNNNKTYNQSKITITSDVYDCHLHDGLMDYYLYFNVNISVDRITEMNFNYSYHKENSYIGNLIKANYCYQKGNITISSDSDVLENINSFDKFISKKIFRSNKKIMDNFQVGKYTHEDKIYTNRMKFLTVGVTWDLLCNMSFNWNVQNVMYNLSNGYVRIDEFEPIYISYSKDGVEHNKIYVNDNVVIGDDGKPTNIDDPEFNSPNPWNLIEFIKLLIQNIKNNTLKFNLFITYYGAVIECVLLLFILIFIFRFIIFVTKLKLQKKFS